MSDRRHDESRQFSAFMSCSELFSTRFYLSQVSACRPLSDLRTCYGSGALGDFLNPDWLVARKLLCLHLGELFVLYLWNHRLDFRNDFGLVAYHPSICLVGL